MSVERFSGDSQDYLDCIVRSLRGIGFPEPFTVPTDDTYYLVGYLNELGLFPAVDRTPSIHTSSETELSQKIKSWLIETDHINPFRSSGTFHVCPEAEPNFLKNLSYISETDKYPPIIIHYGDRPIGLMKLTGEPTIYIFERNKKHNLFPDTIGSSLPIARLARKLRAKRELEDQEKSEANSTTIELDYGKFIRNTLPMVDGVYTLSLDEISDPSRDRRVIAHRSSTFGISSEFLEKLDQDTGYYADVKTKLGQCPALLYETCEKLMALETNELLIEEGSGELKLVNAGTEPTIIV